MAAITVRGLPKHYGAWRAVDGLDLTIEEGEVFALLGPNGAGKSTTIRIVVTHSTPTAGGVQVRAGPDPGVHGVGEDRADEVLAFSRRRDRAARPISRGL